jgi:hypothetical protein
VWTRSSGDKKRRTEVMRQRYSEDSAEGDEREEAERCRGVGRRHCRGRRAGRHGELRRRQKRLATGGLRRSSTRALLTRAPRARAAGAVRADACGAGVGRRLAARAGGRERRNRPPLGAVRAARRDPRARARWPRGVGRAAVSAAELDAEHPISSASSATWPTPGRGCAGRISCCFPPKRALVRDPACVSVALCGVGALGTSYAPVSLPSSVVDRPADAWACGRAR